ncbi:Ger(x)C family spore germination protein [Heliobacterium chlorum]|uniref:Ger(X)C family spore germination protein n=1 Tax=Heliobacterium chlorum TaxID=2698 RepID=A0ABR7T4V4_HELCL|nr:Ger(x)C family spore germination protein [Heliobacterium chlorum]MBC9785808.1 Ger(x)C family spore germination protein [Heliobacterium chlorum]
MKKSACVLLVIWHLFVLWSMAGCWNFREIRDLAVVIGASFDKKDDQIYLTVEVLNPKGGEQDRGTSGSLGIKPQLFEGSGKTVFEAVRNMISKVGRKLYWSHARVFIVSEDVAKEGIIQIIDWINRDAEVRPQTWILVSKGQAAGDILRTRSKLFDTVSMQIDTLLRSQGNSGKLLAVTVGDFMEEMQKPGVGAVAPTVESMKDEREQIPEVTGSALFREERLVGFLNGEETMYLLFLRNQMKKGTLIAATADHPKANVSLEVFRSHTIKTVRLVDDRPVVDIWIDCLTGIAEISKENDVISERGSQKLTERTNERLQNKITDTIKKVQKEYGTDVFGFGNLIYRERPDIWGTIPKGGWSKVFPTVGTNVNVNIMLRGSAKLSEPTRVGE